MNIYSLMDLDMMPSAPVRMRDKDQCRLSKCCEVVRLIISSDMFCEFHCPRSIDGTIWPPRTSREVMLDNMFICIGNDGLRNGIMTAFDTLHEFQAVCDKPRCGYPSPTSNIKKRFDT